MSPGDIENSKSQTVEKIMILVILYLQTLLLTRKKLLATLLNLLRICYASFTYFHCPQVTPQIPNSLGNDSFGYLVPADTVSNQKKQLATFLHLLPISYASFRNCLCPPPGHLGTFYKRRFILHLRGYQRYHITSGLKYCLVHYTYCSWQSVISV